MPASKFKTANILIFGILLYLVVIAVNDGFMALDEYWVGITRYIPAQTSTLNTLVATDDVKSPLQLLPMHAVAQAALALSIESPYWQYRFVILILGLFCTGLLLYGFLKFAKVKKFSTSETNFLLLMLIFYFGAPFALTRPMFESLAAPFLTLAAVFALKYDESENLSDLLWGVVFASVAFVLRQQLGFCALVFVILPILKRNVRQVFYAGGLGLLLFAFSGLPDYFLRGKFHYSLLNLTVYNFEHGSDYGNRTVFFYPLLILVIGFIPFFIKKYPAQVTAGYLRKNRSLLFMVGLFIFLHSLFPQKWERFVISLIPILIFLIFPFLYFLHTEFRNNRLRLLLLHGLNGSLFVIASFFPAQKNLIEMSRYLNDHPEVKTIYRIDATPEWITEAFILNKKFAFSDLPTAELVKTDWNDCGRMLVLSEAQEENLQSISQSLKLKARFNVNLIEQLAYKLNPKNNLRRVRLSLYSGC